MPYFNETRLQWPRHSHRMRQEDQTLPVHLRNRTQFTGTKVRPPQKRLHTRDKRRRRSGHGIQGANWTDTRVY